VFFGVGLPVSGLFVHSNVASLPLGPDTLNLMLWLPNKVIRLKGPHDSKASQHMDVGQGDCHWPMTKYEGIISIGPKV
jgi:hypothetical protein